MTLSGFFQGRAHVMHGLFHNHSLPDQKKICLQIHFRRVSNSKRSHKSRILRQVAWWSRSKYNTYTFLIPNSIVPTIFFFIHSKHTVNYMDHHWIRSSITGYTCVISSILFVDFGYQKIGGSSPWFCDHRYTTPIRS